MNRPWRPGRAAQGPSLGPRLLAIGMAVLVLGALGWLFGSRLVTWGRLSVEVDALRAQEEAMLREISELKERLAVAGDPEVVEQEARSLLGWGYPDEERLIVIWR